MWGMRGQGEITNTQHQLPITNASSAILEKPQIYQSFLFIKTKTKNNCFYHCESLNLKLKWSTKKLIFRFLDSYIEKNVNSK